MRALKMRSAMAGHRKLTRINWEEHQNWSSYNYTRSCWRTQCGLRYGHSVFTANWKGEKDRQVGASWANDKSKCHGFKVSFSLILCNNSEPFFNQIMTCDEKWILKDNLWRAAQWLDGEEASKHFPKANLHQKKKKGHGHCLEVCCWSDPLQLSKFQQNHYIWEVCSTNQWDAPKRASPAASISQQKGPSSSPWRCPTAHCTISASKEMNELGYEVLPLLPYSPDLLTID